VQSSPAALYPKLRPGAARSAHESVASNQRARLYGAMIEMLATRGYEASTVAELSALAWVSKRTWYERFPGGKQECFLATYDIVVRARLRKGRAAELELLAGELLPEIKTFRCNRMRSEANAIGHGPRGGNQPVRRTSPKDPCRSGSHDEHRRGIGNHE
jgi:AcrR family transcriptional regulator